VSYWASKLKAEDPRIFSQPLGWANIETQATQPTQGRAAQVSVIHTFEYVSAS